MDLSRDYINMCKQAKEIQDFYIEAFNKVKKEIEGSYYFTDFLYEEKSFYEIENRNDKNYLIWIPRQDQLQNMIIKEYEGYLAPTRGLIVAFEKFTDRLSLPFQNSMEKSWLLFVMRIKYSKIWSESEGRWIKDEWTKEDLDKSKKKADKLGTKLKWGSHSTKKSKEK